MFTGRVGRILTLVVAISLLVTPFSFSDEAVSILSDGPDDVPVAFPRASHRLIVELESPSLATWYQSAPEAKGPDGRLEVNSGVAQGYIAQLEVEQAAFVDEMQAALPDASVSAFFDESGELGALSYQILLNAVTVDAGKTDAATAIRALRRIAGVKNVYRDYEQKPDMYASIPLIDAPAMWDQLGGQGMSGEGIIIASIDTGVYAPNPFFDAKDFEYPAGYPVGDPSYTTEKVIGARAYFRAWDPPLPTDQGAWPGPNSSSHGTHTAGTAAGNAGTLASVAGLEYTISGVAPRAYILSYRIGYPTASEYSGSAFDAEIVLAYEDAVLEGADVINYSFGGYSGVMPWASATAVARDKAWDAGVFVSHSAGNDGPGASTTADASPKVMEVGASTNASASIGRASSEAMSAWQGAELDAEAQFDLAGQQIGRVPDVMASFSSRGPAFARFLEPDITAPGAYILSAGYAPGATGIHRHEGFGTVGGTSMAAPHVAGSAALLKQMHPDWTPSQIMSALKSTSVTEIWLDADRTIPAGVLDMGAGRIDLSKAGNPGLTFMPSSLSFGAHRAGAVVTIPIEATDVSGDGGTYTVTVVADAPIRAAVSTDSLTFAAGETGRVEVTVDTAGADVGDYGGFVYLEDGTHENHIPLWVRIEAAPGNARVLLLDNDFSFLQGYPDYAEFYTSALDNLGVAYDYWDADMHFDNPRTIPTAAELAAYDVIIYWSGDNSEPDGSHAVSTPLTVIDMQILTDWQFNGGRLLVSGQDVALAWDAEDSHGNGYFIYSGNLGTKHLQDSIFDPSYEEMLPPVPAVAGVAGSPFSGMKLDISGSDAITDTVEGSVIITGWEDGADNQYYVDEVELAPFGDTSAPETIKPILSAIGGYPVGEGMVASSRADGPTLEEPQTAFDYRTIYLSFGFEGVNSDTGFTTRDQLMERMLDWLTDEVTVEMAPAVGDVLSMTTLEAEADSSADAVVIQYRWDFGDGSPIAITQTPAAIHVYDSVGRYWAQVEVMDELGHTSISEPAQVIIGSWLWLPMVYQSGP